MEVGTYQMKIKINQKSLLAALNKMNAFLRSSEMLTLSAKSRGLYLFGKSNSTNISSEIKLTTKTEQRIKNNVTQLDLFEDIPE